MKQDEKKLFLLDAFALIYRAHFALSKNPRINSRGMNTGAIMGFTNSLIEILTKEQPTHIAVAYDTSAPTFRHQAFSEYKATRQEQPEDIKIAIPYTKKIIEGFKIPILEMDGYEADDIIGTLARKAEKEGFKVYMMTPDKDFAQLVTDNVFLYKPAYMGNSVEILGEQEVLDKFNIRYVDQVRDFLGMKGDSIDNIPGIPGVGDKTAAKLLQTYETIEDVVENQDNLKGSIKKKITEHGQQGIVSKALATIKTDVPIEFDVDLMAVKDADKDKLHPIFDELEFRTISKRVFDDKVISSSGSGEDQLSLFDGAEEASENQKSTVKDLNVDYQLIKSEGAIENLINTLEACKEFCLDTETTSLNTNDAELVGISFSIKKNEAFFVAFPEDFNASKKLLDQFKPVLENNSIVKIGQNLKYDIQILKNYDVLLQGPIFDTMLAHYLIDPDTTHKMDVLAENYLNYSPISIESLIGKKGNKQKSMRSIDQEILKEYACEDADITLQLKHILEKEITKLNLKNLLHNVEQPLSFVLADMEYDGISIDTKVLSDMSEQLSKDILTEQKAIFEIAGTEFNIASPKQLGEILFDRLKIIEKPKKTKSGQYATNEDILSKLASEHEIVDKILTFREYQKLKNTYVDTLPQLISKKDSRLHTDYRQTIAVTGRLSSNNPNLQNIPIRTEKGRMIRKAFIARNDDYKILSADYSQIELRIMAAFSKDESMTEAFVNDRDIHATTASKVFKVPLEEVNPSMRRKAKEVNFGIIYGISAFGLAQNLNILRREAGDIIKSYFEEFPKVKEYMDEIIQKAKKQEYVETLLGRRRYLRDINSRNPTVRGFSERNAINAPIQGSAADMIKIAMIKIHQWLTENKLKSKMLLQVHDELVFEVYKDEEETVRKNVENFMKHALVISVPMKIGIGIGKNWLEAH
ncbi:MAG TPA: DNA polymerase I [Cyclobacteriaceae bacterium]